jgi:2,4-dienoyl-CoA reductase-like NADH-dependent reductase (Old Yellow Enzyme family)
MSSEIPNKFMESFKALFNPIKIGNIILKNRIMLARPLFADLEFVQKIMEGRTDRIIKCMKDLICKKSTTQGMDAVCSQWKK